jgi:hypothetical protein
VKLPEDKQKRVKILVAIGMGAALVILGVVQGIIVPLARVRKEKRARIEECRNGLEEARRQIRAAAATLDQNAEALQAISEISDRYVLRPVLGNYLLEATETLEGHAHNADVQLQSIREVGISEIPSEGGGERALKSYTVRVDLQCSYRDVARLLREIETSSPYLCLTALTISGQPEVTPEVHQVSFNIQWPIWADPETPARLKEQMEEETEL